MDTDLLTQAKNILSTVKRIAVVGISNKPGRSSHGVAQYLQRYYTVIPVNPNLTEWEGIKCYPNLKAIPEKVDLLNVFRRSEEVMPVVEEAIELGIPAIWMQLGVMNEMAAQKAQATGIKVIMDSCIAVVDRQIRG